MSLLRQAATAVPTATLIVVTPSGGRSRVPIETLPFSLGRQADNQIILRDNRASRKHARIVREGGQYFLEDLSSRHGTFVNGEKITRHQLANSDRIDFGFQDSYSLIFTLEEDEIHRILDQIAPPAVTGGTGGNLAKLRALVEVARALQTSLTTDEVLVSVVDAALAVTGCERGFLLLRKGTDLEVSVARDCCGAGLTAEELNVPTSLINRALKSRRELLSMTFDPSEENGVRPETSVADLDLRSVVCVPLVHVRTGGSQDTVVTSVADTVGLLYMDTRQGTADLSSGNREILQTLALEASTILENARLLEEERQKQRLDEELKIAREIQTGLLPGELPATGWFQAAGSSVASLQVGGDYFDVRQADPNTWCAIVADVSGKGVSSALLAALLQGAFMLTSDEVTEGIDRSMARINRFLTERAKGEKYATVFYCTVSKDGTLRWANAGHPKPVVVRGADGSLRELETTGMPLGMIEFAQYGVLEVKLQPGDKVVAFSDGLSEAENADGKFFDRNGLQAAIQANAGLDSRGLHAAVMAAVEAFTEDSVISDDITLLVFEYSPEAIGG